MTVRGIDILGGISFSNELMYTPSLTVALPIWYREYVTGHDEMKVFANGKVFWGIVKKLVEDKANETLTVYLDHVVAEWEYRQISVNNAIKDQKINVVFKGSIIGEKVNGITVSANDFDIFDTEMEVFTDKQYVQRAAANAWNSGGDPQSITRVEKGEREVVKEAASEDEEDELADEYKVTFWSGEASVTVKASIKKYPERDEDDEDWEEPEPIEDEENDEPSVIDQIGDIFADMNFAYPGWRMNYSEGAKDFVIDYVYSRQNKLEALTKTMELTPDLFWRVRFVNERVIDVSPFGDRKNYTLSLKPSGMNNIRLVSEPKITHEFDNVINLATVYSEKSDSGMSSLTLREVYENPDLQEEGFPVIILRANVNNERDYRMYSTQFPKLAPNNELEYAVVDEESVALEGGTVIEGTFAFNDISPFTPEVDEETQEVSDEDRVKAAKTAYHAAIKELKYARRLYSITFMTEELPAEIAPGDRVRLLYDNSLIILEECSAYQKKILSYDDWFVVSKIAYRIDDTGAETDTLTLEKEIRLNREDNGLYAE